MTHVDLESPEHSALIREDLDNIYKKDNNIHIPTDKNTAIKLDLESALNRGVDQNLDARVAFIENLIEQSDISLEKLRTLPNIQTKSMYEGRTNVASSSSKSIITKNQSLEPSQSTDQHKRTAELDLTWNLIDTALAISETKNAKEEEKISHQRHRKVIQNIQRDVYSTYWKTLAHQKTAKTTKRLVNQLKTQRQALQKAANDGLISPDDANRKTEALNKQIEDLQTKQEELALSEIELKSLLTLPPDATIELKDESGEFEKTYNTLLKTDMTSLEWEALNNRPEINEEILKKNISEENIRKELIKTVPGLQLVTGGNFDDNSFLTNQNWGNYSASIMQSLNTLITAPARHRKAKNESILSDARRQALVLAILAQTHIAHSRLEFANEQRKTSISGKKLAAHNAFSVQKQQQSGFLSNADVIKARAEKQSKELDMQLATVRLHDSYAAFTNTLGREILPSNEYQGGADE